MYAGTVNGGVWRSDDVTATEVALNLGTPFLPSNFWTPLTDNQPSLAVASMAVDPLDPNNTLWVGTGSTSSDYENGGPQSYSLDHRRGTELGQPGCFRFTGPIVSICPTETLDPTTGKEVILVGTATQGLWISYDGGARFTQVAGVLAPSSVQNADVSSIVADRQNADRYYASMSVTTAPVFYRRYRAQAATPSSTGPSRPVPFPWRSVNP